ncbi:MAG TPA: porin [Steroidobacteraceae bacterium]|jgi:predicted porin|nr:porin [Steroidobacteraceae bacterium]
MISEQAFSGQGTSEVRGRRTTVLIGAVVLLGTLLAATTAAQAQIVGPALANNGGDDSLTWKGITLYGIVDIGLQYQNHGAPISDYFPPGGEDIIQKNSNKSVLGFTPSNLSQSRIGLSGREPLVGDWSAVFRMETFFNPQSGDISDALKSLVLNNGKALAAQNTGVDSSVAGQIFQQAYAGFSSKTFGQVTFGRQNTIYADGIAKYDPMGAAQAFSLIGFSGTAAGGGDTEDRRLDDSLKYVLTSHGIHLGAEYKFNGSHGAANSAFEAQLGGEYAGLSIDGYYLKVKDAVSVAALSAAQVADLTTVGNASFGLPVGNSLSGTISDNTTYSVLAMYDFGAPKIYGGYEHIQYANPTDPLTPGYVDEGGYIIAFVNAQAGADATFVNDKVLQIYWAGVKYVFAPRFEVTAAYYGIRQNSYAIGANTGCSTDKAGNCSGKENVYSLAGVLHMSKRFDGYAGLMYSQVSDGLANGYLNTYIVVPTIGVRFKF